MTRKKPLYVTELNSVDVLLGRGSGPNDHEGNIRFRNYVNDRKGDYNATNHRVTKGKIAKDIIHRITLQDKGRFLKRLELKEAHELGLVDASNPFVTYYEVIDEETAIEKAKQALRQNPLGKVLEGSGVGSVAGGDSVRSGDSITPPRQRPTIADANKLLQDYELKNSINANHANKLQNIAPTNLSGSTASTMANPYLEPTPLPVSAGVRMTRDQIAEYHRQQLLSSQMPSPAFESMRNDMQHQGLVDGHAAMVNSMVGMYIDSNSVPSYGMTTQQQSLDTLPFQQLQQLQQHQQQRSQHNQPLQQQNHTIPHQDLQELQQYLQQSTDRGMNHALHSMSLFEMTPQQPQPSDVTNGNSNWAYGALPPSTYQSEHVNPESLDATSLHIPSLMAVMNDQGSRSTKVAQSTIDQVQNSQLPNQEERPDSKSYTLSDSSIEVGRLSININTIDNEYTKTTGGAGNVSRHALFLQQMNDSAASQSSVADELGELPDMSRVNYRLTSMSMTEIDTHRPPRRGRRSSMEPDIDSRKGASRSSIENDVDDLADTLSIMSTDGSKGGPYLNQSHRNRGMFGSAGTMGTIDRDAFGSVTDMSLGTVRSSVFSLSNRRASNGSNVPPRQINPSFVNKKSAPFNPDDSGNMSFSSHIDPRLSVRASVYSTLSMSDSFGCSVLDDFEDDDGQTATESIRRFEKDDSNHNPKIVIGDDENEDFDEVLNEVRNDLDAFARNN